MSYCPVCYRRIDSRRFHDCRLPRPEYAPAETAAVIDERLASRAAEFREIVAGLDEAVAEGARLEELASLVEAKQKQLWEAKRRLQMQEDRKAILACEGK